MEDKITGVDRGQKLTGIDTSSSWMLRSRRIIEEVEPE